MSETRRKLVLLNLADTLQNVSLACRLAGFSRDSFYRFRKRYEKGGVEALDTITRRKPNVKNRVSADVENAVKRIAAKEPHWGQERVAAELSAQGVRVSPSGVRSIWQRHGLETSAKRRDVAKNQGERCGA